MDRISIHEKVISATKSAIDEGDWVGIGEFMR
jgi:hypothetical protein